MSPEGAGKVIGSARVVVGSTATMVINEEKWTIRPTGEVGGWVVERDKEEEMGNE